MEAGYADIDITPPPGEEMTGYGFFRNRRAKGTMDRLMARALALGDGQTRAVIVQCDLLGLSKEFVARVRRAAERQFGLIPERLMLHCTHTHTGPAVMDLYGCGQPSEHILWDLQDQLLRAIGGALDTLQEASATHRFEVPFPEGFAMNREGRPDLDPHLRGLRIQFRDTQPIIIISYACHPVTLGVADQYSADYPGAIIREFNAYGTRAIYLNGPSGDINPRSHSYSWGSGTAETLLIYGRDTAAAVRRALEDALPWTPGPLRVCSRMVPVQTQAPTVEQLTQALDEFRRALDEKPQDGMRRVEVMWCERLLQLRKEDRFSEAMAAEVQAIACGEVVFVGLGAETFTALGQVIRASAPAHHLMLAATSNGMLGYIGTREDVEKRAYASFSAAKIYGMSIPLPGAGEQWAAGAAKVVETAIGATVPAAVAET